ncbi:hypothetical protein TeGR_g6982 [Tetraparma gracilis]|uniref:Uncharacterized protein n=1 Tax=Tetraparma gracilis TaxID=2962635 RepID=A0ABQ6MNS0_9STRA|nr:hypothetical protein TeGR_g6982 [Tetraparma gracilis]
MKLATAVLIPLLNAATQASAMYRSGSTESVFDGEFVDEDHPGCARSVSVSEDGVSALVYGESGDPGSSDCANAVAWEKEAVVNGKSNPPSIKIKGLQGMNLMGEFLESEGILFSNGRLWAKKGVAAAGVEEKLCYEHVDIGYGTYQWERGVAKVCAEDSDCVSSDGNEVMCSSYYPEGARGGAGGEAGGGAGGETTCYQHIPIGYGAYEGWGATGVGCSEDSECTSNCGGCEAVCSEDYPRVP